MHFCIGLHFCSNCWYRVRPEIREDHETHEAVVRFVHPVGLGKDEDGWMIPNPEDGEGQSKGGAGSDRVLSLEEISKHSKKAGSSQ